MDQTICEITAALEGCLPDQKIEFVTSFVEWFGLESRVVAREPKPSSQQILQLQGAIEVIVRCSDQMRDYRVQPGGGRPDAIFIQMLFEMGDAYGLSSEIGNSFKSAQAKNGLRQRVH